MAKETLYELVDNLPKDNITIKALHALDFLLPGEWENVVGFEHTIQVVSREKDQDMIQKIGERAIRLYNDRSQGYQRAVWLYQTIDSTDKALATAAIANKVGSRIGLLSFLTRITPKADTAQTIDVSLKLTGEVIAFCLVNGLPGDSVADFVRSLADYSGESLMRMAALVCFDGIVPLGTDFVDLTIDSLEKIKPDELADNETFKKVSSLIPGSGVNEQLGFIQHSMTSVRDWMKSFINNNNLHAEKITGSLRNFVDVTEDKLDYLGAFIDLTTNYFEHTGIQTVANHLIRRAVSEI